LATKQNQTIGLLRYHFDALVGRLIDSHGLWGDLKPNDAGSAPSGAPIREIEVKSLIQIPLQRLDCDIIGLYAALKNDVPSIRDCEIFLSHYDSLRNWKNSVTAGR